MLPLLTQFLSNRSQYVLMDGCRSKPVNVVSGVFQSSVLAAQLCFLYIEELFSMLEDKICGYSYMDEDDSDNMEMRPIVIIWK